MDDCRIGWRGCWERIHIASAVTGSTEAVAEASTTAKTTFRKAARGARSRDTFANQDRPAVVLNLCPRGFTRIRVYGRRLITKKHCIP